MNNKDNQKPQMKNTVFSIGVFDTKKYDIEYFNSANKEFNFEIKFYDARLTLDTIPLVKNHDAVCVFVNDQVDEQIIAQLKENKIQLIALRCAGYNNVNLDAAKNNKIPVVRVPSYSPYAVAEHTIGLLLTLNRKIHRAFNRVREGNFSLSGMVGYDMYGKTFGIIGTGRIGKILANIVNGFGCRLLVNDKYPDKDWAESVKAEYVERETLYKESDFIALLSPLNHETFHMINHQSLALMKPNVILVNTSRGGLIDSQALVEALKHNRIAGACLDVYEEEAGVFYEDLSNTNITDDTLARLLTFNNVLITSHQAFLTNEALTNIAHTTLKNIDSYLKGENLENMVSE